MFCTTFLFWFRKLLFHVAFGSRSPKAKISHILFQMLSGLSVSCVVRTLIFIFEKYMGTHFMTVCILFQLMENMFSIIAFLIPVTRHQRWLFLTISAFLTAVFAHASNSGDCGGEKRLQIELAMTIYNRTSLIGLPPYCTPWNFRPQSL